MPARTPFAILFNVVIVISLITIALSVVAFLLERAFKFYALIFIALIAIFVLAWLAKFVDQSLKAYSKAVKQATKESLR